MGTIYVSEEGSGNLQPIGLRRTSKMSEVCLAIEFMCVHVRVCVCACVGLLLLFRRGCVY